jgi:glucose-1-phosphate thymidylyltransferase
MEGGLKGIILAGGSGTRLYPVTIPVIKQLLPIYDKPMIYYPLAVLMLAGVRDILIISTPKDLPRFEEIFGDGKCLGLGFSYAEQDEPRGIAEALIIGEEFTGNEDVWLVLGDNIFFGHGLPDLLREASKQNEGATIFGYYVSDPERYGVVEFDKTGKVLSIEEKPQKPRSNYAVTGLYFYDSNGPKIAKSIKPSARGELEITDVNNEYLKMGKLSVKLMGRGFAWLDTGTHDSLLDASDFVRIVEKRQSLKIACVEEIAYRLGYIGRERLKELIGPLEKTNYGKYLLDIIKDEHAV